MLHKIQQSPGQYTWETLAGAAGTYDASVAEVHGSMKLTLLGYSNLSDKLGESTLCRSTTSGTDCIPILTGPQPWFVEEPSHVVNNDAVPDSRVIVPPGYVEEFDEFMRNKSVRMEGVAYGGGKNTFAQVVQPGGQESSLWSPSGSDSMKVSGSLLTIAMPAAAVIPPITLSNPWCFEPMHFYG
ncbi:hypothetical protein NCS56_01545000 [Fusarium sp. Ph1]|nr:hypothetical protein NCS56_01545000 [Fusarium sp. Ph1]